MKWTSGHSLYAECGWQRRGKINFLFAHRRSSSRRWTARALHLHFTQSSRAGCLPILFEKKRTSNQEAAPRALRGGLPIIHPLPNVAGSAVYRSHIFLLNGVVVVVGDGQRTHSTSTSRRAAGQDDCRRLCLLKRKKTDLESRRRTLGGKGRTSDHSPPVKCGLQRRG